MATRRDVDALNAEDDEEPNPFLSPPPPELTPSIDAPPLPPRVHGSTSSSMGNDGAASTNGHRRGGSRSRSGQSNPFNNGNPFADLQSSQQPQPGTLTGTSTAMVRRPSRSPPAVPPPPVRRETPSNAARGRSSRSTSPNNTVPGSTSTALTTTTGHRRSRSRSQGGSSGGGGAAPTTALAVVPPPETTSTAVVPATTPAAAVGTPSPTAAASGQRRSGGWSWGSLGRTLFGAVLGPSSGGGGETDGAAGGCGDRGSGGVRGRARSARELTPHVMQQTPEGKFNVSVWRKNKQDAQPVQIAVGIYDSAYEGQRAAEAFSSPKWQEPAGDSRCAVCDSTFGFLMKRRHHCRNCGRLVCSACAETFWPKNMLPPTYNVDTSEKKVRVCSTCYGAGEQFRKALLAGSEENAMAAYSTGCVNLRVPYTIYHNELPVHCAAAGGNLNILAWLVEDRCCPLFLDRAKKVALGDSRRMSVMAAAAASGHVQIMRYLSYTQGCKVTEIRDMHTLWGALEKCLHEGADVVPNDEANIRSSRRHGDGQASASAAGGGGGGGGGGYPGLAVGGGEAEVAAPVGDDDDCCIVCFERKVDCTLVPCGHHCCCLVCAAQFEQCPVCRADVEQKIRAISV